ncbi:hypothetical protein L1887_08294 [Cichorium endivia]|nr:hypothetical protein L1887_08294 [Cichorium endivia]
MDPAPEAAPAPKTPSPVSPSSSSPLPSDSSPPSPPKDSREFPPPAAPLPTPSKQPPSRKRRPSSNLGPPNVYPPRGSASDRAKPDPANKLPKQSNRKSPAKSSTDSDSISDSATTTGITIIAGIATALVVILALVIVCLLCNRKKKKPYYLDPSHEKPPGVPGGVPNYYGKPDHVVKFGGGPGGSSNWGQSPPIIDGRASSGARMSGTSVMSLAYRCQFSYDELAAATGGFARFNILGQGGFGYVHKGVLPNGQEVAVKSLKAGSGQGEREFQAEVEIISRVHHRYLVSLVGYCICDAERMLVYEYVPNKTLEFHLHGRSQLVLDWQTRMHIALGSAKGLAYLHEDCHPRIIHRDIKSANILLDHEYEAKVADFGLAKLTSSNDTHVSTRVMGTFGYLAPEYASSGKLTEKSDVFSYGVMLLEMLTGRKPVDPSNDYMDDSLVDWAKPLIAKAAEDGDYSELVDSRLKGNYDQNEMARMASCAAAAVRHSAKRRPKMSQIVRALEGDASLDSLSEHATKGGTPSTGESRSYDTRDYNDDIMKFRKMVMSSQEYETNDYSDRSSLSNEINRS